MSFKFNKTFQSILKIDDFVARLKMCQTAEPVLQKVKCKNNKSGNMIQGVTD